ncbi:MAG TPA: hypothetical protein VMH86_12410 [Rhizomicrobium sp.]|nr:hypothetical protein [Rhizomicrobium sp.]
MEEIDPEQAKVMDTLAPFLKRLYVLFDGAIDLYTEKYPADVRAQHTDRAAANNVYCHAWHALELEFSEEPDFRFRELKGRLNVLLIGDAIVLRLKKVDANGRWRNHKSKQQAKFDGQLPLPGLPPEATRVVLGYQPDAAFSCVERVILRPARGTWVSQIVEDGPAYEWVDITPKTLPFGEVRSKAAR